MRIEVKHSMKFTIGLLAVVLGCSDDSTTVPIDEGIMIVGQVTSEGEPVRGATVRTVPASTAVKTDTEGEFSIEKIPRPSTSVTFIVVASSEGLGSTQRLLTVSSEGSRVFRVDLDIPREDARPPGQRGSPLDLRKTLQLDGDVVVFVVEILNDADTPISAVQVSDTIDATFRHRFREEQIQLDRERFPEATIVVDPERFSASISLGTIEPTEGFVELFRVAVPIPQVAGIYCNRARIRGASEEGEISQRDAICLSR